MRRPIRQSLKYYLSVEGETEKWYFERLRDLINSCDGARYKVTLKCDVEKEPLAMAKRLVIPKGTTIDVYHVFDFESESPQHRENFQEALRQMRDAGRTGKSLRYHSAYSNYAFDLWMVLHRTGVAHCGHRREYLRQINAAFGTSFAKMDEYKREANFKALLAGIGIDDVIAAVRRAREMNRATDAGGSRTAEHCGYTYRLDNPYTEVHEVVGRMLEETGVVRAEGSRRTG